MDIAVLDDYAGAAAEFADWSRLQAQGRVDFFSDRPAGSDALVQRLSPYEAVVLMRERTAFPAGVIDRLGRLGLIVTTGRSNAALDVAAARARGIIVCHTGGISSSTVELTWSLILAHSRHLVREVNQLTAGGWQSTIGRDLADATLGVIGLGRIGSKVASVGRAFGMEVIAWSRTLNAERAAASGAVAVPYEDLLARSDVLTIHVPLTSTTRQLIGGEALGAMKPTALLVNTSRSRIVDAVALGEALAKGRLGGAAIDVFDVEPPPADEPFLTFERVLATPHLGYVTRNGMERFYRDAVEDVEAYLAGSPIRVVSAP